MKTITQPELVNRQPAVAGKFYPANKDTLNKMLGELFSKAVPKKANNVIAIICPHAGYVFSGIVAASSFNQIDADKKYKDIFVIGSSHYFSFDGASIYTIGNYITPLGMVDVDIPLTLKLKEENKVFNFNTEAHNGEHCIEAELPFLQYKMKTEYKIVPIILGTQDPYVCREIAKALKPYFTPDNLFIISSDFSHYPAYKDAQMNDERTADAIISNNPNTLIGTLKENASRDIPNLLTSLCGWSSVLTLMYMTENNKDLSYSKIKYMNSGDNPEYGEKDQVVGYYSIVVSDNDPQPQQQTSLFNFTEKDKKDMLKIARQTIKEYVKDKKFPRIDSSIYSDNLKQECGAFVTLTENKQLRGCVGTFKAETPLYDVIRDMAIASATEDPRFDPVKPDEVDNLKIEISVLSPMKRIKSIDEIQMGRDGIYIKKGYQSGTFLPQVAKETKWTKEEFLGHCAQDKAGIGWNGWKDKDAEIYTYQAYVFDE